MLDIIGGGLFGTIFGGLFRLAPEVLKFLDRKNERQHELSMFNRQCELEQIRGEMKLAEIGLSVGTPSLVIKAGMDPSILVRRVEKSATCPSSHASEATMTGMTAFKTSDQFTVQQAKQYYRGSLLAAVHHAELDGMVPIYLWLFEERLPLESSQFGQVTYLVALLRLLPVLRCQAWDGYQQTAH